MLAVQRFTATGAVDTAFRIYRRCFVPLLLLSAVVNIPSAAFGVASVLAQQRITTWVGDMERDPSTAVAFVLIFIAFMVVSMGVMIVAGMFGVAGATRIASLVALGRVPSLGDAIREALHVFWPLLGASLLSGLAVLAGTMFFFVPGVIVYLGLAFLAPVVVIERTRAVEALGRSWQLTRGRKLKVLVALLLVAVIFMAVFGGAALLAALAGLFVGDFGRQIIEQVLSQVMSVLVTPIWNVALVLLYYDARVEQEAFDVTMLAQSSVQP